MFQPVKVCRKWVYLEVCWVAFECFKRFYEGLDAFWTVFGYFWLFLDLFGVENWSMWPWIGRKWVQNHPKNGSFLGDFEPFLGRSGIILGSLRDPFGIILGSFLCRFDPILRPFFGPCLYHFGLFFLPVLRFRPFSRSYVCRCTMAIKTPFCVTATAPLFFLGTQHIRRMNKSWQQCSVRKHPFQILSRVGRVQLTGGRWSFFQDLHFLFLAILKLSWMFFWPCLGAWVVFDFDLIFCLYLPLRLFGVVLQCCAISVESLSANARMSLAFLSCPSAREPFVSFFKVSFFLFHLSAWSRCSYLWRALILKLNRFTSNLPFSVPFLHRIFS